MHFRLFVILLELVEMLNQFIWSHSILGGQSPWSPPKHACPSLPSTNGSRSSLFSSRLCHTLWTLSVSCVMILQYGVSKNLSFRIDHNFSIGLRPFFIHSLAILSPWTSHCRFFLDAIFKFSEVCGSLNSSRHTSVHTTRNAKCLENFYTMYALRTFIASNPEGKSWWRSN